MPWHQQATKDVIVRDPVVITAGYPRFMAPGDKARLRFQPAADQPAHIGPIEGEPDIGAPLPDADNGAEQQQRRRMQRGRFRSDGPCAPGSPRSPAEEIRNGPATAVRN